MARSEFLQIRITPAEKAKLKRLAAAADQDVSSYVLTRVLPQARQRFDDLVSALGGVDAEDRYVLAELNDLLSAATGAELSELVAPPGIARLSSFLQNYVAAMVEHAAGQKEQRPPAWTAAIAPLETPYFATSLKSLRLHLLKVSPVPYRRRNIFVDAGVGARV